VDRGGRVARRTASLWTEDLDEVAAASDGYVGPLKTQVAGPWTLAASIELHRGERAVTDPGAAREIVESLAEGVRRHLADLRRLVPGAEVVLQLDEPSLPAVLEGLLPTASGFGRLRAIDRQVVAAGLRTVLAATGGPTVIHCCARNAPIPLLRGIAPGALALDVLDATPARWESIAATLESGVDLYAGCLPTTPVTSGADAVRDAVRGIRDGFERAGLAAVDLSRVTVTSACGLAGLTPKGAHDVLRVALDTARELTEEANR
jgi:methionine synthase II (cobalamin-independent)